MELLKNRFKKIFKHVFQLFNFFSTFYNLYDISYIKLITEYKNAS